MYIWVGITKNSESGSTVSVQKPSDSVSDIRNFFKRIEQNNLNSDTDNDNYTVVPSGKI